MLACVREKAEQQALLGVAPSATQVHRQSGGRIRERGARAVPVGGGSTKPLTAGYNNK